MMLPFLCKAYFMKFLTLLLDTFTQTNIIMKNYFKLFTVLIAVTLISCNNKPITEEQGFEYGTAKDGRYTNKFFDIKMSIPKDWDVQSQKESDALMEEGKDMVAGDNKKMKAALKAGEINTANLLTVFKVKPGTNTNEFNSSIMMVAENLKNAPFITSGDKYLTQTRKIMMAGEMKYDHIDEVFKKKMINGWEFYTMHVVATFNGIEVQQTYLATIKDGFAIGLIYSYADEVQKAEIEKWINTFNYYRKK